MQVISTPKNTNIYFENLDFLRFFLALEVLVFHIPEISHHFGLPSTQNYVFLSHDKGKGVLAVFWFFVLSGFLLSCLAKKEMGQYRFSIKKFLARRILRIWPVYYLVMTIGIVLYYFILPYLHIPFQNNASLSTTVILSYLFLSNILQKVYDPGGILTVTWSVSLEEQFYLLFPFWVTLFFKNKSIRWISALTALVIIILTDTFWQPYPSGILEYFELYIEFFVIGILASELLPFFLTLSKWTKKILFFLALILFILSFLTDIVNLNLPVYIFNRIFFGIVAAFVILVFSSSDIKITNKIILTGGRISYGIYMYHMIVITGLVYLTKSLLTEFAQNHQTITIIALNLCAIILTYAVAYISYITFEKYFLSKKPY